jgi:hypothetical protein
MPITTSDYSIKENVMPKLFVRERRHAGEGTGRPRFAIVAVHDTDLKVFKPRIRREELEKLAAEIEAEIVYLPRGEHAEDEDWPRRGRRHGGRGRHQGGGE